MNQVKRPSSKSIKVAIVGMGNCASSLIQGIHYYKGKQPKDAIGLMHWDIGGYSPSDIDVVAAFDIDQRKVGQDTSDAIFADPNCTVVFFREIPKSGVNVQMGRILDGFSDHMRDYPDERTFVLADALEADRDVASKKVSKTEAVQSVTAEPLPDDEAYRDRKSTRLNSSHTDISRMPSSA